MSSNTVVCLLLLALAAVALAAALPHPKGADSVGMRYKKWYNWNDPQEMPSKKWYDWQDMPAAEKMKRGGASKLGSQASAEMYNYNFHPENPFEFNFGRL